MSEDQERIVRGAQALRVARLERKPIGRISESFGLSGLDVAYRIARINVDLAIKSGRTITGKKIGLTSTVVQAQLGVGEPDFGVLFDNMELLDGAEIAINQLIAPKAEGEIAFVIGADLDQPSLSWGQFLRGLDFALPAIEIVDSAIADWKITLFDTVADNASSGLYVLGTNPVSIGSFSPVECTMNLDRNGNSESAGNGVACMGNPLLATYWLARTMLRYGQPLRAGEVILSGALGPMVTFGQGDVLRVDISSLGHVECVAV